MMFLKKDINILTRKHEIIDDLYIQIANSHDVKNELTRLDYLISCVRGKRVLHIGCCDHLSLIDTKIANGTWLHGIFLQEAASCFGIDIDKDAIMYLTKKKYKNIYVRFFFRNHLFCKRILVHLLLNINRYIFHV